MWCKGQGDYEGGEEILEILDDIVSEDAPRVRVSKSMGKQQFRVARL